MALHSTLADPLGLFAIGWADSQAEALSLAGKIL
jgi:hypothetical protein